MAAESLERPRVVIRVDAGPEIGLGHLSRMRPLAEALVRRGLSVELIGRGIAEGVDAGSSWTVTAFDAPTTDVSEDLSLTASLSGATAPDLVLVDHYALGEQWERGMAERFPQARIVAIDDLSGRTHAVDILIDPNLGVSGPKLAFGASALALVGPAYAPLSSEYRETADERPYVSARPEILVTLGGGRSGIVERLATAIAGEPRLRRAGFQFVVPDASERAEVSRIFEGRARCIVHGRVPSLKPLLEQADLVVGAGGTSAWQLLRLGRPSVMVTLAENQVRTAAALRDLGLARWVDPGADARSVVDAVVDSLDDDTLRRNAQLYGPLLVDGRGVDRIVLALLHPSVPPSLRPLEVEDAPALLAMANDPVTRAASRATRSIRPEEHLAWFRQTREAMGHTSWVAEIDGLVIGQVRFAKLDEGWELHYGLDPVARGRGWSSGMVTEGLRRLVESGRTGDVFAVVHPANEVSRRSLAKLGFLPDDAGRAAAAGARLPEGFTAYVRTGGTASR